MDIKYYLEKIKKQTDSLLERYLPDESLEPVILHKAMRYSTLAGGKRLRPILAYTAYEYCGGETEGDDLPIHYAMAALEMVHTYSLIHDDLPCMDDDDLRRGMPTCHKKFGTAAAVLAGDALHDIAFNLIASTGSTSVVVELAHALGTSGMIGGQMADVEAEGKDVTKEDIINIHTRKTGALIRASVRIGAILAGANDDTMDKLTKYAEKIGLAFQIIDDILDVEGDTETLGKNVGADDEHKKATYPRAVGMETAKADAQKLITDAVALVNEYDNNVLIHLARFIGERNK
ncbi:MAG: polyprenyl synthetase family protein [Calditrichaeota bacterium]|nr:MAG: polyprenyl synthetase family protein [Calditrichota bacterium]